MGKIEVPKPSNVFSERAGWDTTRDIFSNNPLLLNTENVQQSLRDGLLTNPDSTADTSIRAQAIQQITDIALAVATFGINPQSDPSVYQHMLNQGTEEYSLPPVRSGSLIEAGIIRNPLRIATVRLRDQARNRRKGRPAENRIRCHLCSPEERRDLWEATTALSQALPLELIQFTGTSKETFAPPIIEIRETYTIAIPIDDTVADILRSYNLSHTDIDGLELTDIDGLELDVQGRYIIGRTNSGKWEILFLGENLIPHRHVRHFGRYLRIDLTEPDELRIVEDITKALNIQPQKLSTDLVATNEQVASMLTIACDSVRQTLIQQPDS